MTESSSCSRSSADDAVATVIIDAVLVIANVLKVALVVIVICTCTRNSSTVKIVVGMIVIAVVAIVVVVSTELVKIVTEIVSSDSSRDSHILCSSGSFRCWLLWPPVERSNQFD